MIFTSKYQKIVINSTVSEDLPVVLIQPKFFLLVRAVEITKDNVIEVDAVRLILFEEETIYNGSV